MSLFGAAKPAGTGLFGSTLGTNTNTQQTGGSLFGGSLGSNTQQNQQQGGGGLFSALGQSTQQNQSQQTGSGLFGNLGQGQPTQPTGLFGAQSTQTNTQPQAGGLFGSLGQTSQPQQAGGLFGGIGQNNQQQQTSGLFGNSTTRLNQSTAQPFPQLGQNPAMWQPNSGISPGEKTVPEKMKSVLEKWDTSNQNCAFKYYFYNKVEENLAPYYQPAPNEDPKAWEEALSKKPGPGYIPVLCVGFAQMGERITLQQRNLAGFNRRLHDINNALTKMMQEHETRTSIRAMDARRKHIVLKQRCLTLATKVQVLRNRGYAMAGDEEDLKTKLSLLERSVNDPALNARGEEIWARMLTVQERARLLKNEIERSGGESLDVLDEELSNRAKKILEDYNTQLTHLKNELDRIHQDFIDWEKEQGNMLKPKAPAKVDNQTRSLRFV